jgi:hypothetical protein
VRRYAARRDSNEPALLANVEPLGGFWIAAPPKYEQHRAGYEQDRTGHTMRLLARTPWRRP